MVPQTLVLLGIAENRRSGRAYTSTMSWHRKERYALAIFEAPQRAVGTLTLFQPDAGSPVRVHVRLSHLRPGHRHAFHIHQYGDVRLGCRSAGTHWDPAGTGLHGGPDCLRRHHAGDLCNNLPPADVEGTVDFSFTDPCASLTLYGDDSAYGCGVVIHEGTDDLGLGAGDSKRNGNAGACRACAPLVRCSRETMETGEPVAAAAATPASLSTTNLHSHLRQRLGLQ